jgi:hypothetical protein
MARSNSLPVKKTQISRILILLFFFYKPQSVVLEQGRGSSFLRLDNHRNGFGPLIQPFSDFPRPYLRDPKIIRLGIPITYLLTKPIICLFQ